MYYTNDNIVLLERTAPHAPWLPSNGLTFYQPTPSCVKQRTISYKSTAHVPVLHEINYLHMFHYMCGHPK